MLRPEQEDLLDYCFLAAEGHPNRAPLCLNTVYQMLTAPSMFRPISLSPTRVILYHRLSGKNLICAQTVNISALLTRLHCRLRVGSGATPLTLSHQAPPPFSAQAVQLY